MDMGEVAAAWGRREGLRKRRWVRRSQVFRIPAALPRPVFGRRAVCVRRNLRKLPEPASPIDLCGF
jgi:hypothetical protein